MKLSLINGGRGMIFNVLGRYFIVKLIKRVLNPWFLLREKSPL